MTSGRDEYQAPRPLFEALACEFNLRHDLAANAVNALTGSFSAGPCAGADCRTCGLHEHLTLQRGAGIWCNPPYSDLGPWVERFAALGRYVPVVTVLPVATTSAWWHVMVATAHELRFPRQRIQFIHDGSCSCKSCASNERGSNRGENVIGIWLPYQRPAQPLVRWGWEVGCDAV